MPWEVHQMRIDPLTQSRSLKQMKSHIAWSVLLVVKWYTYVHSSTAYKYMCTNVPQIVVFGTKKLWMATRIRTTSKIRHRPRRYVHQCRPHDAYMCSCSFKSHITCGWCLSNGRLPYSITLHGCMQMFMLTNNNNREHQILSHKIFQNENVLFMLQLSYPTPLHKLQISCMKP